ncbi:MAG: hypothetical protein AAB316_19885 [Bacteroidota bacterium]
MTTPLLAFDEVAEFIASLDPGKLLTLKPSSKVQSRLEELIAKKKRAGISEDEQYELDRYLALEHLIALAKARARIRLAA